MREGIITFDGNLNAIIDETKRQADCRCQPDEKQTGTIIKIYDPNAIREISHQFIRDYERMSSNASTVRAHMVQSQGKDGDYTFSNLHDKTDYEATSGIILETCQENAVRAMEDTAIQDPLNKMVRVNIMEKLKQELDTTRKLEEFVKHIANISKPYVQFDPQEAAKVTPGNTRAIMMSMVLALPQSDWETSDFKGRLIQSFTQNVPVFYPNQDVVTNYKKDEIVVISAYAGFPLRWLFNLKVCKKKYDALVSTQNEKSSLNRMLLHTESFTEELPELFDDYRMSLIYYKLMHF